MVATNSHLQDLMYDFYSTVNSRELGKRWYGPVQIASAIQTNSYTSPVLSIPYPEKTIFSSVYYVANGPLTAGTVVLESAFIAGFTGTWAALETKQFSGGTAVGVSISSFTNGPHLHLRIRTTAALVGGTMDIYYLGV